MNTNEIRSALKSLRKAERRLNELLEQARLQELVSIRNVLVPETVCVSGYSIGKYPVTNQEYACFVADTGYAAPKHWKEGVIPKGKENHPVVYVSYNDAEAYCKWLSGKTGRNFRLPTSDEWTQAAVGDENREYPWGNDKPDHTRCNFNMNVGDTTPVNAYPNGVSLYGVWDMSGNVWEWTREA